MKNRNPPPLFHRIIPTPSPSIAILITLLLLLLFTISPPSTSTYHSLFLSLSSNTSAARHLLALTRRPHVAGSHANAIAATYVLNTLSSSSIPPHISSYKTLLSYPLHRSLSLSANLSDPSIPFNLTQQIYPNDPYADVAAEVLPTFHAYSQSGTVAGRLVYANYGRIEDFAALKKAEVDVSGNVVIARYGEIFRGDIVRNAQAAGAVAAVVYTDWKDYGGGGRGKWFPDDRWMPPSGVQVGSTYRGIGDPTTPGWASVAGCERIGIGEVVESELIAAIPSLPVSSRDGEAMLRTIGGKVAWDDWQGGEGAPVYRLGPGPGFVHLSYLGNETMMMIQNVIAVIEGREEPDRYVLLGNHRDAWTFGAVDPNSGTSALLEVAERLNKLQKRGWKPRRSIILCNWDAEEYGLLGSTEWVEENRDVLASRAVAYLNVDSAVSGPGFHAMATPQLDELLKEAAKKVQDPDNSSQTLYDSWVISDYPLIGRLGGGGTDFAAFVQHVGIPSVDLSFGEGYPVYHSMFDDFIWMEKYGDPLFHRHVAAASIWGLVALKLADEEFLPFDYMTYASELQQSTEFFEKGVLERSVTFSPIYKSIEELKKAADKIDCEIMKLRRKSWFSPWKKDLIKVREVNDRLMMTERAFTNREGLHERPWYKHLIYGPSQYDDYGSKSFPGIDDAIENAKKLNTSNSWRFVQHEVWRVARAITQASLVLSGDLK